MICYTYINSRGSFISKIYGTELLYHTQTNYKIYSVCNYFIKLVIAPWVKLNIFKSMYQSLRISAIIIFVLFTNTNNSNNFLLFKFNILIFYTAHTNSISYFVSKTCLNCRPLIHLIYKEKSKLLRKGWKFPL